MKSAEEKPFRGRLIVITLNDGTERDGSWDGTKFRDHDHVTIKEEDIKDWRYKN